MEPALLIARLILAVVFSVAGVAKAADPAGTRKAIVGFGVPEWLAGPLRLSLPVAEIVVALALIPRSTAWWGAAAAALLLLVFSAGIGVSLARGSSHDCHCFGQLQSKPISWSLFVRNLALAVIALFIVVQGGGNPGLDAFNWLADLKVGEIVNLVFSLAAVGLLATGVFYLRRVLSQQSTILATLEAMKKVIDERYAEAPVEHAAGSAPLEGLPVGAPAPGFSLASIDGGQVSLDDLLGYGKSVLLLFVSPNCAPCETILVALKDWQRDYGDSLTIALLSKGSLKENQDRLAKYGATHLLLAGESDVTEDYQSKWTPAGVLISRLGRIASQNTYGGEDIRAMVTRAVAALDVSPEDGHAAAGNGHGFQIPVGNSIFKVGDPAPSFSISDLRGNVVNTEDLLGSDTLLLFWDPGCPFCQAMSDDLSRFEENPPKGAPRLLFVASGEVEKVKADSENYKSLFLHDREFQVGPLLGTRSTPSAVLIDREGRIASSVATGSVNVLALAGVRKVAVPMESGS